MSAASDPRVPLRDDQIDGQVRQPARLGAGAVTSVEVGVRRELAERWYGADDSLEFGLQPARVFEEGHYAHMLQV